MKWLMSMTSAIVMFLSMGAARAADAPACDATTTAIANQQAAKVTCPGVCSKAGYGNWNGQWTNTPPSGGQPVCGCTARSKDATTTAIANQQDANNRCPTVCNNANGVWNGQWTNTPPSGGQPVCGCYQMTAKDVTTTAIANQQDASKRCPTVCTNAKGTWNGQWTNTPPSGGQPVCGCITSPAC